MLPYSFDHFNPDYFERLAVALAQEHVAKGILPYGMGRDGGREATYDGRMDYPSQTDPWDGYLVLQAKYKRERSEDKRHEADWAIQQLDGEMRLYQQGARQLPEYYLFVTNAALTPYPERGGLDRFNARLDEWTKTLEMKGAHVWHHDKLEALLNASPQVAGRFGLLHSGDVLHHVAQQATQNQRQTERTLALYIQKELQSDQAVRLAQAGHDAEDPTPLSSVFVDLSARPAGRAHDVEVAAYLQHQLDRPLDPESIRRAVPSDRSDTESDVARGRYAIIGGPGSGKTTLTQHITQRHRAALLLRNGAALNGPLKTAVEAIRNEAVEAGPELPAHPRLPFRVVLDQFADALARETSSSVLGYVASQVARRTGRAFSETDVERLLENGPVLFAFDGLDEVPATSNRDAVVEAIADFLAVAALAKADLAVVATTRPQGYDAEFAPDRFDHLVLQLLSSEKAIAYGRRFAEVRYASDTDRRDKVVSRLEAAVREPATARLMTSPLQVTIMAALVDLVGNPPRERYALFDRYYDIVYQREQERGLGASETLANYRADIDAVHDTVGLLLQIETEGDRRAGTATGGSSGRLSDGQLRTVVVHRLEGEGYQGEDLDRLTDSLLKVALDRLVFIIPREDQRYGFEVRSLQEFAAARALMRGGYEDVKKRLAAVAPAPYWRNVVLFAIGKAFTGREPREDLQDLATTICEDLDAESPYATSLPGARLALDIIEDGIADRKPAYYGKFFARAAGLLSLPDVPSALRLGDAYRETCRSSADRALATADPLAATAFLARLESAGIPWATDALADVWPTDLAASRTAYERLGSEVVWSPERVTHAEQLAGQSTPGWVSGHLSDRVPAGSWVTEARSLDSGQGIDNVPFVPDSAAERELFEPRFHFRVNRASVDAETLEKIKAAGPTHPGWRIILAGLSWVRDPSPEGLAASFEALAKVGDTRDNYVPDALGWQMSSTDFHTSPSDFMAFAERARAGEMGNPEAWAQAEERWRERGFSPSDWGHVTERSWPYDDAIGSRGAAPIASVSASTTKQDPVDLTRQLFLDAIDRAVSGAAKAYLANGFWFYTVAGHRSEMPPPLPFPVIVRVARLDSASLYGDTVAYLVAPHASPETSEDIDAVGRLCRLDVRGSAGKLDATATMSALMPLIVPGADGIVRLVASLVLAGAPPPALHLDPSNFGESGRAALLLIDMHKAPLSPTELVERMVESLPSTRPGTQRYDVQPLIEELMGRKEPASSAASVAPLIVRDIRFPLPIREAAVEVLADLAQRTDSGLASDGLRESVGLSLPSI